MQQSLSTLNKKTFDVAIIGGGINGCAAAQLLTAEGYEVLVVDKADFAAAATSRSARIVHCGLRQMAPDKSVWEFVSRPKSLLMKLLNTRDMAQGQVELARTIPSRLREMDLILPIYRGAGYSGWHVDIGAWLIRLFNRGQVRINYRRWNSPSSSPHPFARHLIDPANVTSVVAFNDLQFNWPERIALDALLNAEANGAVVRNFTEVVSLSQSASGEWQLNLRDVHRPQEEASINAKLVLNLAGGWLDELAGRVRTSNAASRRVIAVKGVHLLIRLPEEFRGAGIVAVNSHGEPFFCLPMDDLHYIGNTETVYHGSLDDIVADEEDFEFLLSEAARLLPQIPIRREDIIMTWAGARPITYDKDLPKGRRLPFGIIQDYSSDGMRNMLGVTWGIIVTHRETARTLLKEVGKRIQPSKRKVPISTFERSYPASTAQLLQEGFPYTVEHVRYAVEHEHARDLAGLFFGRTGMAWSGRLEMSAVQKAAEVMAPLLNWDEAEIYDQIERFKAYLHRYHNYYLPEREIRSLKTG